MERERNPQKYRIYSSRKRSAWLLGGEPDVRFHIAQGGVPTAPGVDFTIGFFGLMGGFGGKTVQGAPYSAEAVTEIVQRLFDGNRIIRKTTASVYRDSEGRTRREQSLGTIGPWVAAGELPPNDLH